MFRELRIIPFLSFLNKSKTVFSPDQHSKSSDVDNFQTALLAVGVQFIYIHGIADQFSLLQCTYCDSYNFGILCFRTVI